MLDQSPLSKEVGGELHAGTKAGPDHGWANTAVQTLDTLGTIDASHTIPRIAVGVLSSDG